MRNVVAVSLWLAVGTGCNLVNGPPKDGECRANLRTIMGGETSLYADHARYSVHPGDVGFAPGPGNRYLYLFNREGLVTRRDDQPSPPASQSVGVGPDTHRRPEATVEKYLAAIPAEVRAELGVHGKCPACEVIVACAGNIDDDPTIDVWSISSQDRAVDGGVVVRGTPMHHVNDREQ